MEPQEPQAGEAEIPAVPTRSRLEPVVLAPPPERVEPLNLARRPFLNSRPVVRVALLLWLLGLALLLVDLWQFLGYRERSADKRERIARSEASDRRSVGVIERYLGQAEDVTIERQNLIEGTDRDSDVRESRSATG